MNPSAENAWLAGHVEDLLRSYHALTGKYLMEPGGDQAKRVNEAPFFLASHGMEDDPILNYGNLRALGLFEMEWEDFVKTPSRLTAEAPNRAERQHLMETVMENGFIDGYSGIRISAKGKRFRIRKATIWNVTDKGGRKTGQAAAFSEWEFL